ncbi:MAG TPA: hypothetical protein VL882_21770 [Vicinamibacterales bacterium]|jgi:hypothetical protein|nr:hypothetical protein [Vicinamibacterales bacterium]
MKRREFLLTAASVATAASSRSIWAQAPKGVKQSTLDRIAIMTLNFQSLLKVPDVEDNPNRTLELFDVAEMIADKYGVHKVEFQHYHIPSTEPSYLKELRSRIEKSKSRMTQINLEFSGLNMSAPRVRDRLLAIDLTKMWVDHAAMLGAQRVMINQGAQGGTANVMPTHENKVYGIPTLKTMADYGKSKGIIVSVETRGGGGGGGRGGRAGGTAPNAPTTPPPPPATPPMPQPEVWALLAEILKGSGALANVDLGGAGATSQEELHQCLRLLIPITAGSIHTRVNQRWDLATAIRFLEHDLGYKGLYTIEAGNGHEGTQPIYDVVVATL